MTVKITPVEFYKVFDAKDSNVRIGAFGEEKFEIDFPIDFTSQNYKSRYAVITNCVFNDSVQLQKLNLIEGIRFNNCTFKGQVTFFEVDSLHQNSTFTNIDESIVFEKCLIQHKLIFHKLDCLRGISIDGCRELNEIYIEYFKSVNGIFSINNCYSVGLIDLKKIFLKNFISITNSNVYRPVRFENVHASSISIHKIVFKKDLYFWSGEISGDISSSENTYNDDFVIEGVPSKQLSIINDSFKKQIHIAFSDHLKKAKGGPTKFYIRSSSFEEGFFVNKEIPVQQFKINEIKIPSTIQLKGLIKFNGLLADKIELSGNNQYADIIFHNTFTKSLHFNNFSNYSGLQFQNLHAISDSNADLNINNSYLGKTQFLNCYFNGFNSVEIEDSILFEIISSCTKWFELKDLNKSLYQKKRKKIKFLKSIWEELVYNYKTNSIFKKPFYSKFRTIFKNNWSDIKFRKQLRGEQDRKLREIFRQLKFAMEKQGDRVQALEFKKYEMVAFRKELKSSKFFLHWDRIIMFFNRSNSYGQNWYKPVVFTLLSNLIFYFFITNSLDINWKTNFSGYWRLLNPAHYQDKIFDSVSNFNCSASFWDLVQRIFVSYFIFQTVSAFRKYIK